jgi:hypothetical protein
MGVVLDGADEVEDTDGRVDDGLAMGSARSELAKVAIATGRASAVTMAARSSSCAVAMLVSARDGAMAQGLGML